MKILGTFGELEIYDSHSLEHFQVQEKEYDEGKLHMHVRKEFFLEDINALFELKLDQYCAHSASGSFGTEDFAWICMYDQICSAIYPGVRNKKAIAILGEELIKERGYLHRFWIMDGKIQGLFLYEQA